MLYLRTSLKLRILLVDDDPHVRSAVRLLLADEPGVQLVGDRAAAAGLVDAVLGSQADAVLVDWDLPGLRGDGELDRLRRCAPGCRIIAMSGRPEERQAALHAGAVDFVCKGDAPESLLSALRQLASVPVE
jgi:DNA-binding NarL/FixJ family response regulator